MADSLPGCTWNNQQWGGSGQVKEFLLLKGAQKSVQNHWEKQLYCLFQLPCVSVLRFGSNSEVLIEGWIVPPKLYLPLVG